MGDAEPVPMLTLDQLKKQVTHEGLLLPYQSSYLKFAAGHSLVVVEKSRRIGLTWAECADDVLYAATQAPHGDDVNYIGTSLDMGREYIDACADWARMFDKAFTHTEEVFKGENGESDIKVFGIKFASGNHIIALPSVARALRGRRGRVVIDEAAFVDDLEAILKAAGALTIWGGQLRVISTHNGVSNPYNQLINDIRAGRKKGGIFRCDFDQAIADGLYERIMLVRGIEPTPKGKAEWIANIRGIYGDNIDEELYCIPSQSGGKYLSRSLLEARAVDVPVLRWAKNNDFTMLPAHIREAECREWCERYLLPEILKIDPKLHVGIGSDFARSGDQSVIWPLVIETSLRRHTPFTIEMSNIPYDQQKQILFYLCDRLARFLAAALDTTGNGEYMGEAMRQKYGDGRVYCIKFTEGFYRENTPKLKARLEDDMMTVPADSETIDDLHMFEVINGVARMPQYRSSAGGGRKRHGDAGVAALLAEFATRQDAVEIEFGSAGFTAGGAASTYTFGNEGFGTVTRTLDYGGF